MASANWTECRPSSSVTGGSRFSAMHQQVMETGNFDDPRPHDPFQDIRAMGSHIDQGAAMADGRILAPGSGNRRIPAGQLGAAHDYFAQRVALDQFFGLLVIDIIPHAEPQHELEPRLAAGFLHPVHFTSRDGQGLFAENMLAGADRLDHLAAMDIRGRGDIDGIDRLFQQFLFSRSAMRNPELAGHGLRARFGNVHDRNQLGIGHHLFEFGDGSPGCNAATPDHTPTDFVRHSASSLKPLTLYLTAENISSRSYSVQ